MRQCDTHRDLVRARPSLCSSPRAWNSDIAGGGQGGVSYEFQVRFGVSSVIVDPRDETLSATQRRTLKWRRQNRAKLAAAMGLGGDGGEGMGVEEGVDGAGGTVLVAAAAAAAAVATSTRTGAPALAVATISTTTTTTTTTTSTQPIHESHLALKIYNSYKDYEARQLKMLVDDDFETSPAGIAALERARVIVGMHPDSATDYIVKLARKHEKCGAIVPCVGLTLDLAALRCPFN